MKLVRSRDNERIKLLARLIASSRERRKQGATVLDGEHLLQAFEASGGVAQAVIITESAMSRPESRRLAESMPAQERLLVSDQVLAHLSQVVTASGILAVIRTPDLPAQSQEVPASIALEDIQDPGNMGSIFRSAAAAGIRHAYLSAGCVFAWAPKVLRAAMGAHFSLTIHEQCDLPALLAQSRIPVLATLPLARTSLYDTDLRSPSVWLFGNEGAGLRAETLSCVTQQVSIPMPGIAESLNVAACAAICLFEQVRQQTPSRSNRD